MRIIAYHTQTNNGTVLITESTGEVCSSSDLVKLFSFILEPYDDTIKVCWDLDATVSAFLRLLGRSACQKLRDTKRYDFDNFGLFYVPDKVFSVRHISGRQCNLYGLEQYFPEIAEPDINETQLLGMKLIKELEKMGLYPTKLTSPVAIYEEAILSRMDLPSLNDVSKEALEMAWKCSGRLWVEAHQLGYWQTTSDYDLSSAFPTIAKNLVDLRDCKWVNSPKYHEAIYGFVKCQVTIHDWVMVSPIIRDTETSDYEVSISPIGTWETYLTKSELDFITQWQIGSFKILDGWWATTTRKALKKPLLAPMERLLEYKQGSEIQRLLAKRMSTGIYGKFGEERADEFGPYFNPVWFSYISTETRLQVADFLYSHNIGPGDNEGYHSLIAIGVDGAMLTTPLEVEGQWKLAYEGPALILSSGLVYTNMTKPKGLKLGEVLEMINAHPRLSYYEKKLRRRLTLGDALAQDRLEDIGKEMDFSVSLNLINPVHDRQFPKTPQSGGQLLSKKFRSKPIRV